MKRCELCNAAARMYCESDQASLCWDCDAKVHSANFLVARHSRSLLCHVCHSPTAWCASGEKLGRTVTVCESCVKGCEGLKKNEEREELERDGEEIDSGDNEYDEDDEDLEDDDDDDDEEEEEEEEEGDEEEDSSGNDEDGDNQVVPSSSTPPPPTSSSSSGEEPSSRFYSGGGAFSLKRFHERTDDLHSDDEYGCSSSYRNSIFSSATAARESGTTSLDSLNRLKRLRILADRPNMVRHGPATSSRTASIVDSLKRFYEKGASSGSNASAAIDGIIDLSKNPAAISSNPSG